MAIKSVATHCAPNGVDATIFCDGNLEAEKALAAAQACNYSCEEDESPTGAKKYTFTASDTLRIITFSSPALSVIKFMQPQNHPFSKEDCQQILTFLDQAGLSDENIIIQSTDHPFPPDKEGAVNNPLRPSRQTTLGKVMAVQIIGTDMLSRPALGYNCTTHMVPPPSGPMIEGQAESRTR
jgi:hypothetical protein